MSHFYSPQVIDMFMWVSHGHMVSSENNHYPVEFNFHSLNFYSVPYTTIDSAYLETLHNKMNNNTCLLITGGCAKIPVVNPLTKINEVLLPPLVFSRTNDNDPLNKYIGFRHYQFFIDPTKLYVSEVNHCENIDYQVKLVHDYAGLNAYYDEYATYSTIIKVAKDYLKQWNQSETRKINPKDVILSLYSCQALSPEFKYLFNLYDLKRYMPKIGDIKITSPTRFLDNLDLIPPSYGVELVNFIFNNNVKLRWDALANQKEKGCGLNILAFYNFINKRKATEMITCLDSKGTSIHKLVDYMRNVEFTSLTKYVSDYFVLRLSIENALSLFVQMYLIPYYNSNIVHNDNVFVVVIVKMYDNVYHNNKINHVGHTISFAFNKKHFYCIDPQQTNPADTISIDSGMKNAMPFEFKDVGKWESFYNKLVNYVKQEYPTKQVMDLVFALKPDGNAPSMQEFKQHFTRTRIKDWIIVPRDIISTTKIIGGQISKPLAIIRTNPKSLKKSKTFKMAHSSASASSSVSFGSFAMNKQSASFKKTTKKYAKLKGDEGFDTFERIMLYHDAANSTKTALSLK